MEREEQIVELVKLLLSLISLALGLFGKKKIVAEEVKVLKRQVGMCALKIEEIERAKNA